MLLRLALRFLRMNKMMRAIMTMMTMAMMMPAIAPPEIFFFFLYFVVLVLRATKERGKASAARSVERRRRTDCRNCIVKSALVGLALRCNYGLCCSKVGEERLKIEDWAGTSHIYMCACQQFCTYAIAPSFLVVAAFGQLLTRNYSALGAACF
jgi:hypothetical protein